MKERTISRTIRVYEVEFLCVDIKSEETFTESHTFTGKFKNDGEILLEGKRAIEPETGEVVVCGIIGKKEATFKYVMPEAEFIKNAERQEIKSEEAKP